MTIPTSPVFFDYPNPLTNAFVMMRFSDTPMHESILSSVRSALSYYGVNGLRADDKSYADSLWDNVRSYIDACAYGIAILEKIEESDFNSNVSLELGYMLAQKKPILILKEKRLDDLPSDIVAHLYKPFDSYAIESSIPPRVFDWLRDIGLAKSDAERLLLFVSYGGTCRCAMAKVALERVLANRHLPYRLRVMSIAYAFGDATEASRGARRAVYQAYGVDYLAEHRVTRRNPGLVEDADLILVMDDKFREDFPAHKVFGFNEFFGLSGDVENPWPDEENDAARERYRACLRHLRTLLEGGLEEILHYLEQ